ncbi:hypothetical protein [Bdellovibrio bacteriovorus]|uniref:hypothetical protein n=1 Tax=Bdellovibrio bacteriovorus TaxID=959 RepID=UPI0005A1F6BD|nr:hypothetical protein [Bdellovibrio bacteriovorus]
MKIRDLEIVFKNANKILSQIRKEHITLKASPIISVGYGQIREGMTTESIIHEAASTLVPSRARQECIYLSILLREARRYCAQIDSSELRKIAESAHEALIRSADLLEISEESHVYLLLDDLDYDLITTLKQNPLLKESPSSKSSIQLSIGKVKDLKFERKDEYT